MIELPEALTLARELADSVTGKTVRRVLPPTKPHKFCWFSGDVAAYDAALAGTKSVSAKGFGIYAELAFENGLRLAVNDGVNLRFVRTETAPKDYQLRIDFTDETSIVCTVAMYGGIVLHNGDYDNEYYQKSLAYTSPFAPEFPALYWSTLAAAKGSLSAKAVLATEQRFPGIGNGVVQDILFSAGVHPKRKLAALDAADREQLLASVVSVLAEMTRRGGRDTEKDLYGNPGGYETRMSKNALATGCPRCGGPVTKEAYLGGSVYYCANCQPLNK